ncbi:hypothetical protein B0H16DRAFT_444003 [Mycena metata]|uniref:CCHC-type domain-containing protein n=1 Tax=Mycena metata TaxID=1033252 RepID=A0AAD7NK13_9AGAR|nr:hypothetical protein B0H16DRAFT_444003 [Mycena metata]
MSPGASTGYSSFSGGGFSSSGGFGGGSNTCYTCGGVGHLSRDCGQGSKCYNCGQVCASWARGEIRDIVPSTRVEVVLTAVCTHPPALRRGSASLLFFFLGTYDTNYHLSFSQGHISRDCPQAQKRACYACGSKECVPSPILPLVSDRCLSHFTKLDLFQTVGSWLIALTHTRMPSTRTPSRHADIARNFLFGNLAEWCHFGTTLGFGAMKLPWGVCMRTYWRWSCSPIICPFCCSEWSMGRRLHSSTLFLYDGRPRC